MAIKYKVVEIKPNFAGKDNGERVYSGRFVQVSKVSLYELAKEISEKSSFSSTDVRGLLEIIAETASQHLNNGQGVDLGELGSLSIDLQSKTSNSRESFTTQNIKRAKLRFTPSMRIKDSLDNADFEPLYD